MNKLVFQKLYKPKQEVSGLISKRDKQVLQRAFDEFMVLADKNFLGDDFRPQFKLSLSFLPSGYNDVEKTLAHVFDCDMIMMRHP
jgi:predicted cation transporter